MSESIIFGIKDGKPYVYSGEKDLNMTEQEEEIAKFLMELFEREAPGVPLGIIRKSKDYITIAYNGETMDVVRFKGTPRTQWIIFSAAVDDFEKARSDERLKKVKSSFKYTFKNVDQINELKDYLVKTAIQVKKIMEDPDHRLR